MGFAREKGNTIVYTGSYMEAFIPEDYFNKGLAEQVGDKYKLFGNFITFHYTSKDQDRSKAQKYAFELPMMFYSAPDDVSKEKIDIGQGEQMYYILHYYKDGVIIAEKNVIKDISNVEAGSTMMMEGKWDNVDYDRIPILFLMNKYYNGANLRVPATYEETIIAQVYRNKKKLDESARFTAKSIGTKTRGLTLRENVAFSSVFSGITFEDKVTMLTVADNRSKSGVKEVISDVEKVSLGSF